MKSEPSQDMQAPKAWICTMKAMNDSKEHCPLMAKKVVLKPVLSNTGRTVNFSRIEARVNPYQRTRALKPLQINTNAHCQQVSRDYLSSAAGLSNESRNSSLQHGSALTQVNNQPPRPIQQVSSFNISNCRVSILPSAPSPDLKPQSAFMRAINKEP